MSDNGMEHGTFTTSKGVTVEFVNIKALLDKLRGQRKQIEAPYYEVKTATGATERHEHDDTTVQTDAERAALIAYRSRVAQEQQDYLLNLTKLIFARGVKFDYPESDDWVKLQEYTGIEVPSDPVERRVHYLTTEAVAGTEDTDAIVLGVMTVSETPEEIIAAMAESFRRALGKTKRDETGGPTTAQDEQGVVLQPKIRGNPRRGKKRHTRNEPV